MSSDDKSLSEVHGSVDVTAIKSPIKRFLAFLGPAYFISIGYMDPGNWATDIAGGSHFGYRLLWILVVSNLVALLLQSFSARLGLVTGRDLSQASRDLFPPFINFTLYLFAEIAIAACDLAEVLGMAIGLKLLFNLPLWIGICLTVLDTFLLLALLHAGIRKLERFILSLIAIIGISFLIELFFARPNWSDAAAGLIPTMPSMEALYLSLAILGATVMPHNLYLHSSLVQTRKFNRSPEGIKRAIRMNFFDSAIALNIALFVNAAILILSAAVFFKNGYFSVNAIEDAYTFLSPLLGSTWAPVLFAVALIAAGQSSTITGTMAGQIIMEGHIQLRIQPWMRRIISRILAVIPALAVCLVKGESYTGDLLVLSQFILSLQLPFAIIPLLHFTSNKKVMGDFAIPTAQKIAGWFAVLSITGLNFYFIFVQMNEWVHDDSLSFTLRFFLSVVCIFVVVFLLMVWIYPNLSGRRQEKKFRLHTQESIEFEIPLKPKKIMIAVDFSKADNKAIARALQMGGLEGEYVLLHIVETAGAFVYGGETQDLETIHDRKVVNNYVAQFSEKGYKASSLLGYGNPKTAIPKLVGENGGELLVMGAHGHTGIKDLLFGTTVEGVRHRIKIPMLVV